MTMDNTFAAGRGDVARRLESLDATLDRAVRAVRRRNLITLVLAILSLCLITYYLWVAHRAFTSWDADRVAMYGQSQLEAQMPDAAEELKRSLRQQAPSVIDTGEQRLRELPDRFSETLEKTVDQQLAAKAPDAEERLYQVLRAGLVEAEKHVDAAGGASGDDEQRFRTMLDSLAQLYGTETLKLLDQLHGSYKTGSADVLGYLDMLAEGQHLTPQQQSQRTMIRNFLILARRHHANSAAVTGGSVVPMPDATGDGGATALAASERIGSGTRATATTRPAATGSRPAPEAAPTRGPGNAPAPTADTAAPAAEPPKPGTRAEQGAPSQPTPAR